jgi:hypothetical protein
LATFGAFSGAVIHPENISFIQLSKHHGDGVPYLLISIFVKERTSYMQQ